MVKRVVEYTEKKNIPLPGRIRSYTPLQSDYHPKLETSMMLETEDSITYQEFIGMLRWVCELGRKDILLETAIMSQYFAPPRKGHLDKLFNIFFRLWIHLGRFIVCRKKLLNQAYTSEHLYVRILKRMDRFTG